MSAILPTSANTSHAGSSKDSKQESPIHPFHNRIFNGPKSKPKIPEVTMTGGFVNTLPKSTFVEVPVTAISPSPIFEKDMVVIQKNNPN